MTDATPDTTTETGDAAAPTQDPRHPRVIPLTLRNVQSLAISQGYDEKEVAAGHFLISDDYVRGVSDLHQVKIERIIVEVPKLNQYGKPAGDTSDLYRQQGKLAPTKRLLERVARAAGVQWYLPGCRIDYVDANSVVYTATGGIRGLGGEMQWVPKTKEWLLEAELIEIHERAAKLTKGWDANKRDATDEEKAAYIRSETARTKANRLANVESKAKNRVIRSLTGIPGVETPEYWKAALFVPRVDVVLDANDPMTRALLVQQATGASQLLGFGGEHTPPMVGAGDDVTTVAVIEEEAS